MMDKQKKRLPSEGEALRQAGFRAEERDGKTGLYHPDVGFIPAGDPGPEDFMVAAPASGGPYTEGEKLYKCGDCGMDVLIARSGQETLAKTPGMKIICLHCMTQHLEIKEEQPL